MGNTTQVGAGPSTIATEELPIEIGGFRLHEACDDRGCWSFDSSTIANDGAGPSTVATEELPIQIGGFRLHEACDDRGCWSFDSSTIAKDGAPVLHCPQNIFL